MKTDDRKVYEKPTLRRVRLEVRSAVLGFCFSSTYPGVYTGNCQNPATTCVKV